MQHDLSEQGLEGKVLLVTGGSRGIGRAIVLGAVLRGARVAFCARSLGPETEEVVATVRRLCGEDRVIAAPADVSREDDVDRLFDAVLSAFGRLDVVVNNAAIVDTRLVVVLPATAWDEVIAADLTGPFLISRRAIRGYLEQASGGSIISIGSVVENGAVSLASYAASKGGLAGLTEAIASDYGREGIYAHIILGGYVDTRLVTDAADGFREYVTQMCPQKRIASAEEIANAALFLAAHPEACVNGGALRVSGGIIDPPPYL